MGIPAPKISPLDDLQTSLARAEQLIEMSKMLNSDLSPSRILEKILDTAILLLGAERGFLVLQEEEKTTVPVARNMDREDILKAKHKVSQTIANTVMETGQPFLSECALEEESLKIVKSVQELNLSSVISVPLIVRGKIIGALYLDHRHKKGAFLQDDLEWLNALRDHAGIAMANAQLLTELEAKNQALENLSKKLEAQNQQLQYAVQSQKEELLQKQQTLEWKYDYSNIVGKSVPIQKIFSLLDKIVDHQEPVIIHGESGTGKELIAKAIHFNGPRRTKPFVSENCAALAPTLIESELFGYVKGAFTGADRDKVGLFAQANGGTLFLDEIGDLDLDLQRKLLRVLQEKEIRPVGSQKTVPINVRIIAATHRDLKEMVTKGTFREDLYYRLNVMTLELPPLRARSEDIPLLVEHFLKMIAEERQQPKKEISPSALEKLCHYQWPGNIRQLENEIRKAATLAEHTIQQNHLTPEIHEHLGVLRAGKPFSYQGGALEAVLDDVEKQVLEAVLKKAEGNKAEAARMLHVTRATLYDKLKKHRLM